MRAAQTTTLSIPAALDARLTRAAAERGEDKEQLVVRALETFLASTPAQAG